MITSLAALACVVVSAVLCYSWICAERELAHAKLELQKALQHRVEVETQKAQEKKSAASPANDDIKTLSAEIKRIKAGIARANRRAYSAEQATGEPDSPAGDSSNAWCPLSPRRPAETVEPRSTSARTTRAACRRPIPPWPPACWTNRRTFFISGSARTGWRSGRLTTLKAIERIAAEGRRTSRRHASVGQRGRKHPRARRR